MTYNQTAQHSTAQHSTAQHSTAQHSTAQHSTEYEKYKNMAGISAQNFLTKPNPNRGIRHVRQANKSGKRRY
ncbi:hypothetical protein [Lactococcus garvieae]|uniref:Uncharacterized protein n=1 Tax=Lactococcus garvieae TaxID=1363 RepID=A0AA46YR89_9LACT|nr:hypothetical protein [Lactococcus garvieae]UYT10800.1 hypothetical protein OF801_02340 [Lactococcus garvieae]